MKQVIIIEGIRYVYEHILLYCPIIETDKKVTKYGLTLILQGMSEKIRILFDSKEERDEKLLSLDNHFGVFTREKEKEEVSITPSFLELEAKKAGFLLG